MSALAQRVRHGLNEARILILGAQVLLGFHFRAPLESGFERLTSTAVALKVGGLVLLLVAVALLMAPAAYHRIVDAGHATARVHRFTTLNWFGVAAWASRRAAAPHNHRRAA